MARSGVVLAWCLLVCGAHPVEADESLASNESITSIESAINRAGHQRMLTQRIVKAYCQIGMEITIKDSRRQLETSLAWFESQLRDLQAYADDDVVRQALSRVDEIWWRFKNLAKTAPDKTRALGLYYMSEDLLYVTNKVALLLQDSSGTTTSRLVNIAGRQRMLSQRLATFYLMRSWGVETISIIDAYNEAEHDFIEALDLLRSAKVNDDRITNEFDEITLQWAWFQNVLRQEDMANYRLIVVDASEAILESMDKVTAYYENLD